MRASPTTSRGPLWIDCDTGRFHGKCRLGSDCQRPARWRITDRYRWPFGPGTPACLQHAKAEAKRIRASRGKVELLPICGVKVRRRA